MISSQGTWPLDHDNRKCNTKYSLQLAYKDSYCVLLHFDKPAKLERKCGTEAELIYRQQEEPQSCKSLSGTQMETAASVLLAGYWFLKLVAIPSRQMSSAYRLNVFSVDSFKVFMWV